MKIYLVRHAQAEWWKAPDESRSLTEKGFEDAERLSETLKDHPIDAIYSSPYTRARQTIEPTASKLGLEIHIADELRERKLGDIDDEDFATAVEKTWRNPKFAHLNGESNAAAQKRAVNLVNKLRAKHRNENIALASHGNIIALILQMFDTSVNFSFWKSLTMPDLHVLEFDQRNNVTVTRIGAPHDR